MIKPLIEKVKLETYNKEDLIELYTFKDLYEDMLEEIKRYEKLDKLEDLMNANISLELLDKKGRVLSGKMNFSAGYLEDDNYHTQGYLEYVEK